MIDDLEAEFLQEEQKEESTTNKFPLTTFNHPSLKPSSTILSMSVSKKFIYLLTNDSQILLIQSYTLIPYQKIIKIPPPLSNSKFKENLSKIWSDRSGNHNMIRHKGGIYYFNSNFSFIKELKSFKNIEICAVGFDDRNVDAKNTRKFLAADNLNNLYECNISLLEKEEDINEKVEKITKLNFSDWENDEEEEDYIDHRKNRNSIDRIYGIKFFKATKTFLQPNEDAYYIIIVTKNKFYQFRGPVINNFRQIFGRYENENIFFSDSCKFFPECFKKKFNENDLNILYRKEKINNGSEEIEIFNQFGWKTESGYCFGKFEYSNSLNSTGLPYEQKQFTVMPFSKINNFGAKIEGQEPVDIAQTNGHIFLLYEDCLTVINKLTSYIVHTQYFNSKYYKIVYNEFSKDNQIMLLASENGLSQISLKNENNEIWKDYLEIGDFHKAQLYCPSENLKKRIFRIEGEEFFEKNDRLNAVNKFIYSDEKFENVCLKYLINNDMDGLSMYLELYMEINLNKEIWKEFKKIEEQKKNYDINNINNEEDKKEYDCVQLFLICNWILEIFLSKSFGKESNLQVFRQTLQDNKNYLLPRLVYEMLLSYGREEEFVEFGSRMGDYEKVILYYINTGEVDKALDKIEWFVAFSDDEETIAKISKIFCTYSHIFFKKNPKKAISILQQNLKDITVELIVHAISSNTDKDKIHKNLSKEEMANNQSILEYIKFLIDKPKYEHESNLHNLYIYYLSKNKAHQQTLIDYLKNLVKDDENENNRFLNKKKEVLFQLSYAKRLLKDNHPAYALILALMGKYEEGVKCALMEQNEDCQKIAKYIASNAPGEKMKKKLWINIFSYNNQNEFKKGLDIMKESKILKIEDILPHITEKIKIEVFKTQISDCIKEYENNIKTLKEDINGYKDASENIKNDINKIKKKSMEIKKNAGKCDICRKIIQDKNIFIFPCGHLFDMFCIKEKLLDYEVTGIDYLHEKNVQIDELFLKLDFTKERIFQGKKNLLENEEESEEEDNNNIKKENTRKIKKVKKKLVIIKRTKNYKQINMLKNHLFGLLSEQCPLCGDFLVDSVQFSLDQKDVFKPDKNGLRLKIPKEPDFLF